MPGQRVRRLIYSVLLVVFVPLAAELAFRALARPLGVDERAIENLRTYLRTGRLASFVPHPYTVFQRSKEGALANTHGFRDFPWPLEREAGELRVLCLGASTTESGNLLGRKGSYPVQLEAELERRTGRPCRVMSAAVSGWTTAEMLVSWFLTLRDFAPDVLVLHEGVSDLAPRFQAGFRSDYSHWRRSLPSSGVHGLERWLTASDLYLHLRLQRQGIPGIGELATHPRRPWKKSADEPLPPGSAAPFLRNLTCIANDARSLGARVVLMTMPSHEVTSDPMSKHWLAGIVELNELVRQLAREGGHELVDAERVFAAREVELAGEFLDLVHLKPGGNQLKAELLAETIVAAFAGGPER